MFEKHRSCGTINVSIVWTTVGHISGLPNSGFTVFACFCWQCKSTAAKLQRTPIKIVITVYELYY